MSRKEVEGLNIEVQSRITPQEERRRRTREPHKRRTGALITLADLVLIVVMGLFLFYITKNERPQQTPEFTYLLKVQEFNNTALISLTVNARNDSHENEVPLAMSFFWHNEREPFYNEVITGDQLNPQHTIYLTTDTPLTADKPETVLNVQITGRENLLLQQKLVKK